MKELVYFDCHARFGPRPKKHRAERWTKAHLLEDLELAGVAGALAVHEQALLYDPMYSNLRLVRELRGDRKVLFPCWVALPPCSGEFPEPRELMKMMADHDVRAVRIAPLPFRIPLREKIWAGLRDSLAERKILALISFPDFNADVEQAAKFLDIFRSVPVLLTDHYWNHWRSVVFLMDEYPDLHLEFSSFQGMRAVEYCAERYGANRCLFGTNLPYKSPGAARAAVDWSFLADKQAALVAGGNLARLLGGAGPRKIPAPGRWSDRITEAARNRKPLPCLALDAHCHMLHDGGNTAGSEYIQLKGDAAGMAEVAGKMGILRTAAMSWTATVCMDAELGNEIVAAAVKRFPKKYTGVVSINPELQSPAEIRKAIGKYHEKLGFPGLEPFPVKQLIGFDDKGYAAWFGYANRNGLYILLDWGHGAAPAAARKVVARYRNATFLAAHAGRSYPHADHVIDLMRKYPHVYAEVDYTAAPNGLVEYFAEKVGAERLLFGTDAPMRDQRQQAGWIVFTRLAERDKRKILGENFNAILKKAWHGKRELHFRDDARLRRSIENTTRKQVGN